MACSNACVKSSGVSSTLPSSTYVKFTVMISSTSFTCGDSTATPRFLATRLDATSAILLSNASFGASSAFEPDRICAAFTSEAPLLLRCEGMSPPRLERTSEAAFWFMFNHCDLRSSLTARSASASRLTMASV